MSRDSQSEKFGGNSNRELDPPRSIVPTPAMMGGQLRGRRVLVGMPGLGWRADLRADEKVVHGSRTYVPVLTEAEWYRAESETTEVFAVLIPVERVWVEELGVAGFGGSRRLPAELSSLDEPPRRQPIVATEADSLTGRRVTRVLEGGQEKRNLRAVTELHTNEDGSVCARVADELDWYRWGWSGKTPRTLEVPARMLWVE